MPKSWRDLSIEAIDKSLRSYQAQCLELGHPKTLEDAKKFLSKAYPFGERKYTPYKVWLEEKNKAAKYIVSNDAKYYLSWRRQKVVPQAKGQLSLFGGRE